MAVANIQYHDNCTRIIRLLVDIGGKALRQIFDSYYPPATLASDLTAYSILLSGLRLHHRIIGTKQWDVLFPNSPCIPDSKTFDITLLAILLRNICGLTAPATGWDDEPAATDRSVEANIVRMRIFRNDDFAHITSTKLYDVEFENTWEKISKVLIDLNIPQSEIDELKNRPLRERSDDEILQQLAKISFKGDVNRLVKSFQPDTRKWLFKKMDVWFADKESRVLILTAGPGVGKSVFAGKACRVYEESGKLAACYFCKFNNSNLRNALYMLQSLASQMCTNVKGFKEKLLDNLKRSFKVHNLRDAFRLHLSEPLHDLKRSEHMLIVIDGIDESETDGKSDLLDLIATEFPTLPTWIKVLVTSRPEIPVKKKLSHLKPLEILPDDKNNESDLQCYLNSCLPKLPKKKTNIGLLVKKCQGSFLFAFYMQSELLKRGYHNDSEIDVLEISPKEIGTVYQNYFDRLENELKAISSTLDVSRLLKILVAARGPLPLKFIAEALGMSPDSEEIQMKERIRKINESVSNLLNVCDDLVTVFHKSVVEWIISSHGYDEDLDTGYGNELLWVACRKEFEEIRKNILDLKLTKAIEYSLSHGLSHLDSVKEHCSRHDDFEWLVDIVIHFALLFYFPNSRHSIHDILRQIPERTCGCNYCDMFTSKMHWIKKMYSHRTYTNFGIPAIILMQDIVNNSPDECFRKEDRETAKSLLKKSIWCEMLNGHGKEEKGIPVPSSDLSKVSGQPVSCSFSPGGSRLASCDNGGEVRIWDVHTGCIVQTFSSPHSCWCYWSKRYLWTFSVCKSTSTLSKFAVDKQSEKIDSTQHVDHDVKNCQVGKVLTFSEGVLVLKCKDGSVSAVDVIDEEFHAPIKVFSVEGVDYECAAVSPGGSCILTAARAIGESRGEYQIWKKDHRVKRHQFKSRYSSVGCCISSDGKFGIIACAPFGEARSVVFECYVVDMNSGSITNTYKYKNFQYLNNCSDMCANSTTFAILNRTVGILYIHDIECGKLSCTFYTTDFLSSISPKCPMTLSKHNILAVQASLHARFRFFRIHIKDE